MSSRVPDGTAAAIVEAARVRTLVSEARASLRDAARRVARAGLEARANARVMKVFSEAAELTDQYLERALDDLAQARGQT